MKYLLLLLAISAVSCRPTLNSVDLKTISPKKVDLLDLIKHRGQYHGKWLEVTGKFMYGEEMIAIESTAYENTSDVFSEYHAVWLRFHPVIHQKHVDDSLEIWKGKLLIVKGYFDSSKQGHMGMYAGTLENVYDVRPIK